MTITDDPCDALSDDLTQWLWHIVMLDRTTNHHARMAIRMSMREHYSKSRYSKAIASLYARSNDPHDPVSYCDVINHRTRNLRSAINQIYGT